MVNGYFQLYPTEQGIYLRVVKAIDGGAEVDGHEVTQYLQTQGIPFDPPTLNQGLQVALVSEMAESSVPLVNQPLQPVSESFSLTISSDRMTATARFYPPSVGGPRLNYDYFVIDLLKKNVSFGVKEEVFKEFLAYPLYCTDYVVAEGTLPRQGSDAYIEYFFNTHLDSRPSLNEDGSVDFFNLNNINHCHAGQLLATLTPEDKGDPGFTVSNEQVRPREVKTAVLRVNKNMTLSPDKLNLTSDVDGHVSFVDGQVFVADVYQVENVDNSTGNINFEGSVVVMGNVNTNFSVKAKGNIEVQGVVEGAELESGGDIVIRRGMKGMGRGKLKATGNVISQFIENSKVEAGGYVSADAIFHSEVIAKDEVTVTSKKGFITGGRVCAGSKVQVKTLGSQMGSDTIIEVGADPTTKNRIQELQKHIMELNKSIKAAQPILNSMAQKIAQGIKLSPDQIEYVRNLTVENKKKNAELEDAMDEIDELQEHLERTGTAQVIVTGDVYSGTMIIIGDVSMTVQNSMSYCRFLVQGGDVKMSAL
jgi:uncharacterized protein (DUF342 family)